MLKIEKKLIEIIQNKSHILFSIFITIISIWIRFEGKENISRDMNVFLLPWYEQIKENGGLLSLQYQVGNYNILYQTIIALFTYLDIKPIYIYKLFSIIFDYALAYTIADNLRSLLNRGIVFFNMVYATVLFLPTLILNSAYWGQCDVIYTFFVILFLFSLYSEKYVKAFVWLGFAFAFKLQAIFILPFALTYYFYKKKFSILYFMVSFITFMSTGIVGYVFGRSIFDPITIYMGQTDTYQSMWLNITSFWQLLGENYEVFSKFAVLITVIICGIGFYFVLIGKKQIDTLEQFFQTALWFVWVMIFFFAGYA